MVGEECPQDLSALLRKMLKKDPYDRISATAILSNPIASQMTKPSDAGFLVIRDLTEMATTNGGRKGEWWGWGWLRLM